MKKAEGNAKKGWGGGENGGAEEAASSNLFLPPLLAHASARPHGGGARGVMRPGGGQLLVRPLMSTGRSESVACVRVSE